MPLSTADNPKDIENVDVFTQHQKKKKNTMIMIAAVVAIIVVVYFVTRKTKTA